MNQAQRAEGKAAFLPRSGSAQIGKCLVEPRRGDTDFPRRQRAGFQFRTGQRAVANLDGGETVFDAEVDRREVEIIGQQIFED